MTPPNPIPPQDDIGPFYRALASLLALGAIGILLIHAHHNKDFSWVDASILGIIGLLVLALIRPRFFDSTVKTLADHLPFFKYEKPDKPSEG